MVIVRAMEVTIMGILKYYLVSFTIIKVKESL